MPKPGRIPDNFQDQMTALVDKWIARGDQIDSMISDLQSEIQRLQFLQAGPQSPEPGGVAA